MNHCILKLLFYYLNYSNDVLDSSNEYNVLDSSNDYFFYDMETNEYENL
jgi:hypothetical protein